MSDQFNPRLSPNEEAVAEKARPAKRLPILCLDFDGVLHGYQSGWQGAAIIPDPPVPGAVQFLHSAVERFQVAIYSSRSGQPGGIDAMRGWLTMWLLAVIEDRREAEHVLSLIQWPTEKPAATVTIDDRAIQFTGEWPSLDEIADFKPWNKRPAPDSTRTGQGEGEEREPVTEAQIRAGVEELAFSPVGDEARTAGGRALVRAIYRAMIAARPAAPEAQGAWRPISTAPKDGTEIWVWLSDSGVRKVRWWSAEEICEEEGRNTPDAYQAGFYEVADRTEWWNPAWWVPADRLPAPPASSGQEG